jgi:D-alanyl-D-alanine carboxypeptidase
VSRRFKLTLVVVLAPVAAGATTAGALSGDDPGRSGADRDVRAANSAAEPPPEVLVVRRRGGVPPSWTRRLRRAAGVTAVARTTRTQVLLRRSVRAGASTIDAVPRGYAIPLDVLVVSQTYADVLPQARREIRRLRSGTALLSRTSARLRRLGVGDRLELAGGRELRITGIIDDALVGLAELIVAPRPAGGGNDATRQLLVATTRPQQVERLARNDAVRIRRLSPAPQTSPRLVARPLEIKARFGEFAVGLPYGSDWIRIEPRWLERNIVTRSVPILGAVTCNRRLFAPLRQALRTLERRGLARVVDPADYAGCFAPRRIPGSGSLSLHAWGLAIDINAATNPRLGDSRQDRRLVRAMEDAGFTWGGRWPTVPDPMHFELHP